MAEAERCLRALAVPFFHHELVKQMLLAAIEGPQHSDALLGLLEKLSASGEVSESQTAQVRLGSFWLPVGPVIADRSSSISLCWARLVTSGSL